VLAEMLESVDVLPVELPAELLPHPASNPAAMAATTIALTNFFFILFTLLLGSANGEHDSL
jgi:hypothetical protein